MTLRQIIVTTFLLCTYIYTGQAQPNIDGKIKEIKEVIRDVVQQENIPAVSAAIIIGDEHHYLNFGTYDRTTQRPVSEESIYQIASLGKMLVGIITQNLILEGTISVDQSISEFFTLDMKSSRKKRLEQITIRHLLHHTSGLRGDAKHVYKRKDGTAYNYDFKEEDFDKELRKIKLYDLGEYRYSNFGYALLAQILEKVSGLTFDQLLSNYICTPYGLENTHLYLPKEKTSSIVTPYRKDKRTKKTEVWKMGKLGAPSAVYSTVADFSKLLKAQLQVYRSEGAEATTKPLSLTYDKITKNEKYGINYGYGINQWTPTIFGHTGDMDGFAVDYSFNIEHNYGIVIFTSSGEKWINPTVIKINRIMMGNSKE